MRAPVRCQPVPGDVFREYPWTTSRMLIPGKDETPVIIPGAFDLEHATRAEVEIANEHLGFEGMAVRINGGTWPSTETPRPPTPARDRTFEPARETECTWARA